METHFKGFEWFSKKAISPTIEEDTSSTGIMCAASLSQVRSGVDETVMSEGAAALKRWEEE